MASELDIFGRSIATSSSRRKKKKLMSFEKRILLFALGAGGFALGVCELMLWFGSYSSQTQWTLTFFLVLAWLIGAFAIRAQVIRPLQTLSNMVAALREEDFSFRARRASRDDALGELVLEINSLSDILQSQRLGSMEAVALLKKVLMEIDVAVFTFDPQQRLRIVNRAGEQLLAMTQERMVGRTAQDLKLENLLSQSGGRTLRMSFPGREGRWAIQQTSFRERGVPHQLLLISDLSRALREEERQAWQRLIRVLGHELNNSLAPIKSIAGTLRSLAARPNRPPDWGQDVERGLEVIESRADALSRFMQAYTKLAKLPAPTFGRVQIGGLVRHAASIEARLPVEVVAGDDIMLDADPDQLEQLLINLLRNAVDASLDPSIRTPGSVQVGWHTNAQAVEVFIRDQGPGLLNSNNLFVPFFTTKSGGSGIGLVLSRQIAEAHGGTLTLENRKDVRGCQATLRLPLDSHAPMQ
jgi:nitrogen fixation/metabolism regulation signal transduction histidine kinase